MNVSDLFFTRLIFCPLLFEPGTQFAVGVSFENLNGTLNQDAHNLDYHTFIAVKENSCFVFSGIVMTPPLKFNGKSARLVAKIKDLHMNLSDNRTVPSKDHKPISMLIKVDILEYHMPSAAEYLIITFSSVFLLSCSAVGLVICRRLRVMRTVRYTEAEVDNDISHFDDLMPALLNPPKPPNQS